MAWIDCAASTLEASTAFHAGATVEFIRGNLLQAQAQSGYDVQTYHHSSSELTHELSSADVWERFTEFHAPVLPARRGDGDDWRRIRVTAEVKREGAAGVATIRLYAGHSEMLSAPHSTSGYSWSACGDIVFSTSTYTLGSTTLDIARVGGVGPANLSAAMLSTMGYAHSIPVVFVNAIAKCTGVSKILMRAPRYDEEASS